MTKAWIGLFRYANEDPKISRWKFKNGKNGMTMRYIQYVRIQSAKRNGSTYSIPKRK